MTSEEKRRKSFDKIAGKYDQFRPEYPEQLVDDVISKTDYRSSDWMLEVGCGTGKATKMFAQKGCKILAIEPGGDLAKIARNNISEYPDCNVEVTKFEDWDPQGRKFKILIAATSYHWVEPDVRYTKPVDVLSNDGWIALFWNNRLDYDSELKVKLDAIYDSFNLERHSGQSEDHQRKFAQEQEQTINASGNFREIQTIYYPWFETHDAESYVNLVNTFAYHQTLDPALKNDLYSKVRELILSFDNKIEIPYLTALTLAKLS